MLGWPVGRVGRARGVAAVLVALLLAGCDGGSAEPDPTETPSDPSTTPSLSSSVSPTESSSAPTTPSGTPAAGAAISLRAVEAAFPEGWEVVDSGEASNSASLYSEDTVGLINVFDLPAFGVTDLDAHVKTTMEGYEDETLKPTRGENRVVAGVEGYVLEGKVQNAEIFYEFSAVHDDRIVSFEFHFERAADATAIIDSVLASVRWK